MLRITTWTRGVELFVGIFAVLDTLAVMSGARASQLSWLLDTRALDGALPPVVAQILSGMAGIALVTAAISSRSDGWRRASATAACAWTAYVAALNTVGFYAAWSHGTIDPALPVPLSLPLALAFVAIARGHMAAVASGSDEGMCDVAVHHSRTSPGRIGRPLGATPAVIAALVCALLFPLAHVYSFGTTDYRRSADAVVVFGARVWPDGRLTTSLGDRVRTAVQLYDQGLVDVLIMSGGTGVEGVDEASAMRDRAVELGVPAEAIITDSEGVDTDATVANSLAICEREGFDSLMAVSQFYHLPRIELAYRAEGREVFTVPAQKSTVIAKTPLFVAREIPGFWVYWGRVWVRDVLG